MPRYPEAIWKPVERYKPGGSSTVPMKPRRLILHTAVSSSDSLYASMSNPGTPTSHFYARMDGVMEQYVDTAQTASAVLEGNHDCITVESWDDAGRVKQWTDAQVESIAKLAAWCKKTHGIPLEPLDSSESGRWGIGWHRLGIDGDFPPGILHGRRPGTELWSDARGKECPYDGKIHGTVDLIIPRAIEISNGDDMSLDDKVNKTHTAKQVLARMDRFIDGSAKRDAALRTLVRQAIEKADEGATPSEIKGLLENIEATIVLEIPDEETP
jgi:hypothetical protein